jgi:hypothetical protein
MILLKVEENAYFVWQINLIDCALGAHLKFRTTPIFFWDAAAYVQPCGGRSQPPGWSAGRGLGQEAEQQEKRAAIQTARKAVRTCPNSEARRRGLVTSTFLK